jgi:DNA-binding transcriptional MocR family regulator
VRFVFCEYDVHFKRLIQSRICACLDRMPVQEGRPCPFVRLTFAYLEEAQLEEGVRRLRAALLNGA